VTVPIRVYVNDRPLDVPRGATACDAVRHLDSVLADRIIAGTASLTDARGIVLAADAVLAPEHRPVSAGPGPRRRWRCRC
jgi:hypothetical protein